ncbi:MAG: permease-like cell division protein FtsX [bacterium]|nr:permease-like cell division protein FtsX [bacterium]
MSSAFNQATQRMRRAPYQTLVALTVTILVFFVAIVFFLDAAAAHKILRYFETRPQVNAFYKQDVVPKPQEIELLRAQLEATGLIESFKFVSKEDALRIYKDLNKNDPLLLEAVTANMLPASVEVSAKNPNDLKLIADTLKGQTGIEDVRFAEDVVDSLLSWTRSVRTSRIVLASTQMLIAFVIILSVIGSRIINRREEISLMQLIGATSGYISAPFVLEGMVYGAVGALAAWIMAYTVILYSTPFFAGFVSEIPGLYPTFMFMLEVLGGAMGLGALVGALGGCLAVRRYLRS